MPKRQTTRSRRPRASRTSGRNRQTPALPTAEYTAKTPENFSALRIVRALKGPNDKYINTQYNALSGVATITSPFISCLNQAAQGTGENNRVGRLLKHKWIDFDIELEIGPNNVMVEALVRVYIVVESTALGSAIAPQQFFVDATNFSPLSQRDRTNRNASRFVVLWDSQPFKLGNPYRTNGTTTMVSSGSGQPCGRSFSKHLPLNFCTDYSRGNAGTYADIDSNSLWILIVSDDTTSNVNVFGAWTTCFQDDS